jgi:hypothetical protein
MIWTHTLYVEGYHTGQHCRILQWAVAALFQLLHNIKVTRQAEVTQCAFVNY